MKVYVLMPFRHKLQIIQIISILCCRFVETDGKGYDRVRRTEIGKKHFKLTHFEEVSMTSYFAENSIHASLFDVLVVHLLFVCEHAFMQLSELKSIHLLVYVLFAGIYYSPLDGSVIQIKTS